MISAAVKIRKTGGSEGKKERNGPPRTLCRHDEYLDSRAVQTEAIYLRQRRSGPIEVVERFFKVRKEVRFAVLERNQDQDRDGEILQTGEVDAEIRTGTREMAVTVWVELTTCGSPCRMGGRCA